MSRWGELIPHDESLCTDDRCTCLCTWCCDDDPPWTTDDIDEEDED